MVARMRGAHLVLLVERADGLVATYTAAKAPATVEVSELDFTSVRVLDAAAGIGSDHERVELLVELARVMPADGGLITRYREVARDLSDYERGVAERALDRFAG
jgi:hypothetical protein